MTVQELFQSYDKALTYVSISILTGFSNVFIIIYHILPMPYMFISIIPMFNIVFDKYNSTEEE